MSPIAMSFDQNKGWTSEELGLRSRHWKRLARQTKETSPSKKVCPAGIKREGPVPLQELDLNILSLKKSKGKCKESKPLNEENKVDGGVVVVASQHRRAQ